METTQGQRRAMLGGLVGCSFIGSAEAREGMKRAPRDNERDHAIVQLVALVEAQQIEMAKLRRALGLNATDGRMYEAAAIVSNPANPLCEKLKTVMCRA